MKTDKTSASIQSDESQASDTDSPSPEMLSELDILFAHLETEIKLLASHPSASIPPKLLELARISCTQISASSDPSKEESAWGKEMGSAVESAVEKVFLEGAEISPDGKMSLNLTPDMMKTHGAPVLNALMGGLQRALSGVLNEEPTAAKEKAQAPEEQSEIAQQVAPSEVSKPKVNINLNSATLMEAIFKALQKGKTKS